MKLFCQITLGVFFGYLAANFVVVALLYLARPTATGFAH